MRIRRSIVNESMISQNLLDHLILDNGIEYIQVHPTFLYESLWNFGLLMFMLWFASGKCSQGKCFVSIWPGMESEERGSKD